MNVEVEVFSAVVGSTSTFIRKTEAATAVFGLLMMGIIMPETC
jgi:hypothetical protein